MLVQQFGFYSVLGRKVNVSYAVSIMATFFSRRDAAKSMGE